MISLVRIPSGVGLPFAIQLCMETTRNEVTADTITDEQIRELERSVTDLSTRAWCAAALRIPRGKIHIKARDVARARCAEILNARMEANHE